MPTAVSAGILLYRMEPAFQVLIVHPGGPLWARRDDGAWSIPKGEAGPGEDLLDVARREFAEEIGSPAPDADPITLGEVRLKSGKRIHAWALPGDLEAAAVVSNSFQMQWPPRSGRTQDFPEVDRAGWFSPAQAREKLNPAQAEFVRRLAGILDSSTTS